MLRRAQQLGFLGPGPVGAHLEHAAAFADAVSEPQVALDLGSGGGVPGLALALRWPSSHWVLLDSNDRRTAFLEQVVGDLDLTERVRVLKARAEQAAHHPEWRGVFDLVVARSFGAPAVTAECGGAFLRIGGHLVVSEPPEEASGRWAGLAELGLEDRGRFGPVRVIARTDRPPDRSPRRVGVPVKRPLW